MLRIINILFQTRYNIFERKGGDTVQLLKTKEALERKYGHILKIDIINKADMNLEAYDIIHIFNLLRPQETYLYLMNAIKYNKPVALSTIYWKSKEFDKNGQIGFRNFLGKFVSSNELERLRLVYRYLFDGERHNGSIKVIEKGFEATQKFILENTNILLPNGEGEIRLLEEVLNTHLNDFVVVPNAINLEEYKTDNTCVHREGVICVGRIEPRKNQLNLVKALSGAPFDVYLIGKVNPTQKKYYNLVKKNSGPNIHFIDEINQEELKKYYRKAKVHVLPSWYDTPGLVSLEAGYYGCNLVVGKDGTTKEYFHDYASYVDPQDVNSIKSAVFHEYYESPTDPTKLSDFIANNYTWEHTAKKTFEGYKTLLKI